MGYYWHAYSFMQFMEAINYHVAAGRFDKDLLQRIIECFMANEYYPESLKLDIIHAIDNGNSIKPDKLYDIENTPIVNKKGVDFDGIQKHLLYILLFGRKFPNGGQLNRMLSYLDKIVEKKLKGFEHKISIKNIKIVDPKDTKKILLTGNLIYTEKERGRKILENIKAIAAICSQIAIENVSKVHYALRVVSRIVNSVEDNDLKWEIFSKVCERLSKRPNSDYDKIWLQNITFQHNKKSGECPYDVPLCQLVMGKRVKLWNNDWLQPSFTKGFPLVSICDKKLLSELTPVIIFRETRAYYE